MLRYAAAESVESALAALRKAGMPAVIAMDETAIPMHDKNANPAHAKNAEQRWNRPF